MYINEWAYDLVGRLSRLNSTARIEGSSEVINNHGTVNGTMASLEFGGQRLKFDLEID